MKKTFQIVLLSLAAAGTACSSLPPGSESASLRDDREVNEALEVLGVVQAEEVNQLMNFQLRSFKAINNRNLIITSGLHDHYLLRLVAPCFDLEFAFTIGIDSGNRSSITRLDDVLVRNLHRRVERCSIDAIYKLDDRDTAL